MRRLLLIASFVTMAWSVGMSQSAKDRPQNDSVANEPKNFWLSFNYGGQSPAEEYSSNGKGYYERLSLEIALGTNTGILVFVDRWEFSPSFGMGFVGNLYRSRHVDVLVMPCLIYSGDYGGMLLNGAVRYKLMDETIGIQLGGGFRSEAQLGFAASNSNHNIWVYTLGAEVALNKLLFR